MKFSRRRFVQAAGAALAATSFPVKSQTGPIRVGLVTVKTGPLASGGIDMERALVQYLKERNDTLAGRKVELIVADSGGVPAQARTKIQELVERDKIHVMIGPLDTASALAADDYIRSSQLLTLSVAAADDMTQRKPNPWFTRGTSTASQCAHPMADYCYKTLGYRRMVLIADDIAYDNHDIDDGLRAGGDAEDGQRDEQRPRSSIGALERAVHGDRTVVAVRGDRVLYPLPQAVIVLVTAGHDSSVSLVHVFE